MKKKTTQRSWDNVSGWYDRLVGTKGHYYHQKILIPGVLELLHLQEDSSARLLDVGCGQGVMARALPKNVHYCGVDKSKSLIEAAKRQTQRRGCRFVHADATQRIPVEEEFFTHGLLLLSLQNMGQPKSVFTQMARALQCSASLVIVLNHPCFRIPSYTHWGVNRSKRQQYREVHRYMCPQKIALQTNPSKGQESEVTYSYHFPLCELFTALADTGFVVSDLKEWCSDKKSEGGAAAMEDLARSEIPLFMALVAHKR